MASYYNRMVEKNTLAAVFVQHAFLKRWSWPQLINHTLFRLARIHYLFIGLSLSHRNMFQRFSAGGKGGVWESGWTVARCCYNGIPLGDSTLPSSVAIWQRTLLAVLLQKYLEMFNLSGVQSSAHYLTKTIVASQNKNKNKFNICSAWWIILPISIL